MQYALTASLGVANAANVAEVCRDAGPKVRQIIWDRPSILWSSSSYKGAHVTDIARVSNIDPSKLGEFSPRSSMRMFNGTRQHASFVPS